MLQRHRKMGFEILRATVAHIAAIGHGYICMLAMGLAVSQDYLYQKSFAGSLKKASLGRNRGVLFGAVRCRLPWSAPAWTAQPLVGVPPPCDALSLACALMCVIDTGNP